MKKKSAVYKLNYKLEHQPSHKKAVVFSAAFAIAFGFGALVRIGIRTAAYRQVSQYEKALEKQEHESMQKLLDRLPPIDLP